MKIKKFKIMKIKKLIIPCLLLLLLASCQSRNNGSIEIGVASDKHSTASSVDSTNPTEPVNTDRTSPKVVAVKIVSERRIELDFSEEMEPSTVTRDNIIFKKDGEDKILTGGEVIVKESKKGIELLLYGNGDTFNLYAGIFRIEFKPNTVKDLAGNSISPTSIYTNRIGNVKIDGSKMWADYGVPDATEWIKARDFCVGLELNGYSGWRLPSKNELQNVITSVPDFRSPDGSTYWTSELYTGYFPDPTLAAFMPPSSGSLTPVGRSGNFYLALSIIGNTGNSILLATHQGIYSHARCIRSL